MYYRSSVLLKRWTWGSGAQTKIVPLDLSSPISRITINAELVNSSYTAVDHPAKAIKNIEIVDGSDVLYSMDGGAAQGMGFYGTRKQPFTLINYVNNDSARSVYTLDFGRYLYDKLYALDPSHFKNLQLKLEIDRSLGACSPDGAFLTVTADLFDEKVPSIVGFFQSKEVYSYAPTDDLTEYIELPVDHPYRMIMIKACAEEEGAIQQVEDFKLAEDFDKHVILDERTEQYIERVCQQFPEWSERMDMRPASGGVACYLTTTHNSQVVMISGVYADVYGAAPWASGQLRTYKANAGNDWFGYNHGVCPHGCFPILFGKPNNPDDFWSPGGIKSLRLALHSRSAADGGVCDQTDSYNKIIVQQVRPY